MGLHLISRRNFVVGLIVTGCASSEPGVVPTPKDDETYNVGGVVTDHTEEGLVYANAFRAENGLGGFKSSAPCVRASLNHAMNMARADKMAHSVPGVGKLGDVATRLRHFKVPRPHAENVAYGYRNVERATQSWINSPGHRRNLLDSRYRYMGVASATHPNSGGKIYWASVYSV